MIKVLYKNLTVAIFALLVALTGSSSVFAGQKYVNTTIVEGEYEVLLEATKEVITGRGIHVAHTLPAGGMLGRTGPSFGFKNKVYLNAEIIEFCSAKISHNLAIANPENIVLCPFAISVYVLTSDPKHVRFSFREPFVMDEDVSKKATAEMVGLVQGIIDEVAEW